MLRSWSFPTLHGAAVRACNTSSRTRSTVPSITDQDKNADNAPSCASYLMIRAARGNRTLYYRVYLGRNNTTDFNVGRNTSHTLDITISGDNEVDTRVHGYTLSVTDDFESNRIGDYCVSSGGLLCIASDATDSTPTLEAEMEVLTTTDSPLAVGSDLCQPNVPLPLRFYNPPWPQLLFL